MRKAHVLFAWDRLGGAVCGVLQPHHEAHLACWPWGLACLPLHPGGLAPASTVSRKERALLDFRHLQQEQLCLWLWGLRFHKPKGCASGSQTPSMRLPSLGSWIKQTVEWLLGVCVFSTPKGQTVTFTLCTKAASAFAVSVFNLFCLRGTCHTIINVVR